MSIRSERIKALVESSGLSYQELEKLTGVKKSSLQRYASGVTTKIPLDVIEKLSNAFNVSQEYLMGWDDATEKEPAPADQELSEMLETLRTREDMRMLFKLSKDATPEDVRQAVKIIEALRKND